MKKSLFLIALLFLVMLSCEYDYYPYPENDSSNYSNSFLINGVVIDSDSLKGIKNIQISMFTNNNSDTITSITDSNGIFNFSFYRSDGASAIFETRDTSNIYGDFDTILHFSGRDFNEGLREFQIRL